MSDSPGRISLWMVDVFAAIADERSISAAARRLGASVSAVSQQLTNLESILEKMNIVVVEEWLSQIHSTQLSFLTSLNGC